MKIGDRVSFDQNGETKTGTITSLSEKGNNLVQVDVDGQQMDVASDELTAEQSADATD